jgi:phosphate acyltransferase
LGLNGIVIKSHGGTDSLGFAAAVDMGYDMARHDLMAKILDTLSAYHRRPLADGADAMAGGE